MDPLSAICRLGKLARTLGERRKKLHRIALAWCRDSALADDLVQETLMKALKNIGQLREIDAIDPWLLQIMTNCWRDHFRRERVAEDIDLLDERSELISETDYAAAEVIEKVREAVARLPATQREVLALVDLQGCSYTEVADLLNIPLGTVTSRICRAREALRHMLHDLVASPPESNVVPLRRIK